MSTGKRNIQILFCVTPEEKKLIHQKMILSKSLCTRLGSIPFSNNRLINKENAIFQESLAPASFSLRKKLLYILFSQF